MGVGIGGGGTSFFSISLTNPQFPHLYNGSGLWWKLNNLMPGKPSNKWVLFIVWDDPGGKPERGRR